MAQFNNQNTSLNSLINIFGQIGDTHAQINSFGQGNNWEVSTQTVQNYPLFWVELQPSTMKENLIEYNFRFYLMDLVFPDLVNLLEVQSDMTLIMWDIVFLLRDMYDLEPKFDIALQMFDAKFADAVGGIYANIILQIPMNYGICDVPQKELCLSTD